MHASKPSKNTPDASKTSPRPSQNCPRRLQMAPRGLQDAPRSLQDASRWLQEGDFGGVSHDASSFELAQDAPELPQRPQGLPKGVPKSFLGSKSGTFYKKKLVFSLKSPGFEHEKPSTFNVTACHDTAVLHRPIS